MGSSNRHSRRIAHIRAVGPRCSAPHDLAPDINVLMLSYNSPASHFKPYPFSFPDVESVKAVSDVLGPVDGTIIAVNEEILDVPESINESPYDAWFVKVSFYLYPLMIL